MAVLTNSLLALRSGWVSDEAPITALALALLVAAGAIFAYGAWRRRDLLKGQGAMAPPAGAIVAAAVITLVACATGLASVLVRQGLWAGSENP